MRDASLVPGGENSINLEVTFPRSVVAQRSHLSSSGSCSDFIFPFFNFLSSALLLAAVVGQWNVVKMCPAFVGQNVD